MFRALIVMTSLPSDPGKESKDIDFRTSIDIMSMEAILRFRELREKIRHNSVFHWYYTFEHIINAPLRL